MLLFTGFDGIFLSKGFSKLVLHKVSNSLHSSRKFSTVLVTSITQNSWYLKMLIALAISSGSIKSLQYSQFFYIFFLNCLQILIINVEIGYYNPTLNC